MIALRPEWWDRAACANGRSHPGVFYRTSGQSQKEAIETCNKCAVREECLVAGFTEIFGIWGGMTGRERQRERARRRKMGLMLIAS